MSPIDVVLLIVLALGTWYGFSKGLILQLFSLLALVLGVYCAFKFSVFVGQYIAAFFDTGPQVTSSLAFLLTFLAVCIGVFLLGKIVHKTVHAVLLGWLNRLLGATLGLVQTVFLISVLFFITNMLNSQLHFLPEESISKSKLYEPVAKVAPAVFPYLQIEKIINKFS